MEHLGAVAGPAQDADRGSDLVAAPVLNFLHRLPLLFPGTADVADVEVDIEPEIEPETQAPTFAPQLAPPDGPLWEVTEVDDDDDDDDDDDYEDQGLTGKTHP